MDGADINGHSAHSDRKEHWWLQRPEGSTSNWNLPKYHAPSSPKPPPYNDGVLSVHQVSLPLNNKQRSERPPPTLDMRAATGFFSGAQKQNKPNRNQTGPRPSRSRLFSTSQGKDMGNRTSF
jgi:hypothetical protein